MIEVSASPPIPFWNVTLGGITPPNPPVVLHGPGCDFSLPKNNICVWNGGVAVGGPTLSVTLHISTGDQLLGAACRVTINGIRQQHFLECQGGGPDDEYNYTIPPAPAAP